MSLDIWRTREPLSDDFRVAWESRLARMPLANFAMRLDWLAWEAAQGRHATAALVGDRGRRGALVLRDVGPEVHCGWPWRWQSGVEDDDAAFAPGLSPGASSWLFEQAERVGDGARVRCFLPAKPLLGEPAFVAGRMVLQSIDHADDALLAGMHANKRRLVRRTRREGLQVREASGLEDFAAFQRLCDEVRAWRHEPVETSPGDFPPPGRGYREWELPWMWLLLASREERLEAALGDGVCPGGVAEGRMAVATEGARRIGAMALLVHEEARRLRDRGYRWLNHGGDTIFKREMAGTFGRRLTMWCWLGGGARWTVSNRFEWLVGRARPALASLTYRLRERIRKASTSASAMVVGALQGLGIEIGAPEAIECCAMLAGVGLLPLA